MKKDNLPLIFSGLTIKDYDTKKNGVFVACSKFQTKKLEVTAYYKKISNFIKK